MVHHINISELHMQLLTQLTDNLVKINENYF